MFSVQHTVFTPLQTCIHATFFASLWSTLSMRTSALLFSIIILLQLISGCTKKTSPPPQPPVAVSITKLEKDDVSITAFWSRSNDPNFAAYELYSLNTVLYPVSGTPPDGRLVARISDRDQLSARDDSVDMYYAYSYMVKVITTAQQEAASPREAIYAGSFINASESSIYDRKRQLFYYGFMSSALRIDPQTLSTENLVELPLSLMFWNLDSTGNKLKCIFNAAYRVFQVGEIDLDAPQVIIGDTFSLGQDYPEAYVGNTVLYQHRITGTNFSTRLMAYNVISKQSSIIHEEHGVFGGIKVISGHRVMLLGSNDSLLVFQENNGDFSLLKTLPRPTLGNLQIFEGTNLLVLGTIVYNQSFDLVHAFPDDIVNGHVEMLLGISSDDRYIFTSDNNLIRTDNWQLVKNYGTGTGGPTYFSNDQTTLFHFTFPPLGFYFMRPMTVRLFRYPL